LADCRDHGGPQRSRFLTSSLRQLLPEFGFTINQLRDWEQARTQSLDGLPYLMIVIATPGAVLDLLRNNAQAARKPEGSLSHGQPQCQLAIRA
jgi:hypothetical protein